MEAGRFLHSAFLEEGLEALAGYCRAGGIPLEVLTRGPQTWVEGLLRVRRIGVARVTGNRARPAGGSPRIGWLPELELVRTNADCRLCPCCRRNAMLSGASDDEVIAYAGEEASGACAAHHADLVFARGRLQARCREENITSRPYGSLRDIRSHLALLGSRGVFRKRLSAEHLRRRAFIAE
ncbi:MAG: hypothetical protein WB626_02840 [Bacteroidota bacterium]